MRRLIVVVLAVLAVAAFAAGPAAAASNPSVHGRPNVSCEDPTITAMPNGFTKDGFANAQAHYADGQHPNADAVSQYDVACYQLTSHAQ